jgi:hypothetical protein
MMKTRMPGDLAQSGQPRDARAVAKNLLHSLSKISAAVIKYFWRPRSASEVTAKNCREKAPVQARPAATAAEDAVVRPTITKSFPASVAADVIIGPETQTDRVAQTVPDNQEIQRRRDLVRTLFNDFWSASHDKPAAFADRLAQAEPYINGRLVACGEFWRLDGETRITLGLPSAKNRTNTR